MAKDMSKVFFNYNGFSLKNILEITWNKPTDPWTQDEEDLYGEHENIYAGSKKIVFTIKIRTNTDDERIMKAAELANLEGIGAVIDKRGSITENIPFDLGVVSILDKTYNKTENTVQILVKARVIADVMI